MNKKILAFSSSRVGDGLYLESAAPIIKTFLGNSNTRIAFVPFAGVSISFEDYTNNVRSALALLGYTIVTVTPENAKDTINDADVIMVGGGNTFKLLSLIYKANILDLIRDKVSVGIPFIGWSAGSNIIGSTICTTNDMPIVEPKSFNALGLFPFQINPHYFNYKIPNQNGETRDDRLKEFLVENPGVHIVCLPEGTALIYENKHLKLIGETKGLIMQIKDEKIIKTDVEINEDISWLL